MKAVSIKVSGAVGFLKHAKFSTKKNFVNSLHMIVNPLFRYCCSAGGCGGFPGVERLRKLQNEL